MNKLLGIAIGLVFAVVSAALAEPDPVALERLVRQDCGSCHGLTLKGGLGPDIRSQALSHYDSQGLATVILDGIPGTAMPPWRPIITEDEAHWIAEYLLSGDNI